MSSYIIIRYLSFNDSEGCQGMSGIFVILLQVNCIGAQDFKLIVYNIECFIRANLRLNSLQSSTDLFGHNFINFDTLTYKILSYAMMSSSLEQNRNGIYIKK